MNRTLLTLLFLCFVVSATSQTIKISLEDGYNTFSLEKEERDYYAKYINCSDKTISELIIPDSIEYQGKKIPVKCIGDTAFAGCNFEYVRLPKQTDSIGAFAFGDCNQLRIIEGVENVRFIGSRAFWNCYRLQAFSIPTNIKAIEPYTFYSCLELKAVIIPEGVESIGDNAFAHCGLESVSLPSTVKRLGSSLTNNDVFFGCVQLKRITVDKNNKYFDSRHGCNAIIETTSNKLISGCYKTTIPNTVISIGKSAFGYRSKLEKIKIPPKVKLIESGAFSYCRNLKKIKVSRFNKRYDSRNDCNAIIQKDFGWLHTACLTTRIPKDIHIIGPRAYQGLTNMGLFIVPDQITEIGNSAFFDCEDIRTIILPKGITSIGSKAFYNCTSLMAITIPEGIKKIEAETFKNCSSLMSVTLPSTLSEVSDNAFENCVNYYQSSH